MLMGHHRLSADLASQLLGGVRRVIAGLLDAVQGPVSQLRAHVTPGMSLVVLGLLLVAAVLTARGDRLAALALVALSLAWLLVNGAFEGPTLLVLSWSHGITAGDLVSVGGLLLAAWRLGTPLVGALRSAL